MISQERRKLYLERIDQLIERLTAEMYWDRRPLEARVAVTAEPVRFDDRRGLEYAGVEEGAAWGKEWQSAWFNVTGTVPDEWHGATVVAYLDFNGEALVFNADGTPVQGLSNGSVFTVYGGRRRYALYDAAQGGERIDLWIEAVASAMFGLTQERDPPRNMPTRHGHYKGVVKKLQMRAWDRDVWHLWLDMRVLRGLLKGLSPESTRAARILRGLSDAADRYADDRSNAADARAILAPLLAKPANATTVKAVALGHSHLDTAWLWPISESIRKVARTFSSQIDLLDRYPATFFGFSQPQLYAFCRDHYPKLYEKVREAVKAGRWELLGAMWVEPDTNLIGGESMVRQVLHGKNFYRDEFGVDVKNLWLPDVFGYSAAIPQIMRRAGVTGFLTQKLGWSQFDKFPHTTFRWRGIDGSELLSHFPPAGTYHTFMYPNELQQAEEKFREKEVLSEMLVLYGMGDGGGGPWPYTIEMARRQHDLEGVPRVEFGRADGFFDRLAGHADELPVWSGELYVENHRGTLTSQARSKRGNRKLELALRETEYLCTHAPLKEYPQDALDAIWKRTLTNQFHDILPGSGIRRVHAEAEAAYEQDASACRQLQLAVADRVFEKADGSLTVMNTLNVPYTRHVQLPESSEARLAGGDGEPIPMQRDADGTVTALLSLPAQGTACLAIEQDSIPAADPVDGLVLENELIRYEFTPDGRLVSGLDKETDRELIPEGEAGNVLTLYQDRPTNFDAWNMDIYYEHQALEQARGESHESLGAGPVRKGLKFTLRVNESEVVQRVYLGAGSKRLDFETAVEWHERHRMLRTAFPVSVYSDEATFDIQYSYIKRPTHRNTTWDMAKFEVTGQQYADLSDMGYGVALLNDCKYGYKVHENVLDLNLLRSPTYPDPDADQGHHEFTYSLLPHRGTLTESSVMHEAAMLNQPPILLPGYRCDTCLPPVTVHGEGVELAALKKAEKENCLVLRLAERRGRRTEAVVDLRDAGTRLVEIDLVEWNVLRDFGGGEIAVAMGPFEIRTFRLEGREA